MPLMVVLYSTNDGHIGLQSIGVNPLRRNQLSGMYVKDGTTTVHDWIGMVPAH